MLSLSIAGIGSAWMGGSARIPFVAGLDSYMPAAMGKVHSRYATPHVALIVQGLVSLVLIVLNFTLSGGVQEAFQKMLSAAVVLQLVPFLYVFAALIRFAVRRSQGGCYGRGTLMFAGVAGLVTTTLAIIVAYFPAKQITSLWKYEVSMFGITLGFIALAVFFFFGYSRLKTPEVVRAGTGDPPVQADGSAVSGRARL
jgi:amino acid transporter